MYVHAHTHIHTHTSCCSCFMAWRARVMRACVSVKLPSCMYSSARMLTSVMSKFSVCICNVICMYVCVCVRESACVCVCVCV